MISLTAWTAAASSPQISTSESIGSSRWPSSVAGRWWNAATTWQRGHGRLHVGGDAAAGWHERLELLVDPHERVGHRHDDLAGEGVVVLLRGRGGGVPRRGDHDQVAVGGGGVVAGIEEADEIGPGCEQLVDLLHGPVLRSRADDRRSRCWRVGRRARCPLVRFRRRCRCAWRQRGTPTAEITKGRTSVAPIIYGPGHGSARRQEDRDHRRPHRRLAGLRGGPTGAAPRGPTSCSPAPGEH